MLFLEPGEAAAAGLPIAEKLIELLADGVVVANSPAFSCAINLLDQVKRRFTPKPISNAFYEMLWPG